MKRVILYTILIVCIHLFTKAQVNFTQNKGQIYNQFYKPNSGVTFSGVAGDIIFHLKETGISYQLNKIISYKTTKDFKSHKEEVVPDTIAVYRIDLNLLNSNSTAEIIAEKPLAGYSNFITDAAMNGVYNVKTYESITYENIYPNINLHYYSKNNNLKYDYVVHPGGDYKQIQIQVSGADNIQISPEGALLIKTPHGTITEAAPLVFQNNLPLNAKWVLKNNIVSFYIKKYDKSKPLIIDPAVRAWGTYYGGSGHDRGFGTATDVSGNVYLCGRSASTGSLMATSGAFITTISGGGYQAFLSKFAPNGSRIWGTYYGGGGQTEGMSCSTDLNGNIFLAGFTSSSATTLIATPGSHQPTPGSSGVSNDAFLTKFDSTGLRLWGTFYGGTGIDVAYGCATDGGGNIYLTGQTCTAGGTAIATPGAHQAIQGDGGNKWDAFLVKFDPSGTRLWGTYYGGINDDYGLGCTVDKNTNDVYITGDSWTGTGTVIATTGCHQNTLAGNTDAFLAKFTQAGVRLWGTYYGGTGNDYGISCITSTLGDVYMCGHTNSSGSTVIATPGSHQAVSTASNSNFDAYLVKFDAGGVRQWGTYYGGLSAENGSSTIVDGASNVYLIGETGSSGTVIATPGSHQPNGSVGAEGFIAKFDPFGVRQWGTFYGGTGYDYATSGAVDFNTNEIYMGGYTDTPSGTAIAYQGLQNTYGGGGTYDAFLVKFKDCFPPSLPVITTPTSNLKICSGTAATLTASGGGNMSWYNSITSTISIGTGSSYITPSLNTGSTISTYTYYATLTNTCTETNKVAITVTVVPLPIITTSSYSICPGDSTTLYATGAIIYSYSSGSAIVAPSVTTSYSITGTNSNGCVNSPPAVSTISVANPPTVTITSSNSLICTGQSATLTAGGAFSYTWSTGAVSFSIVVTPITTSIYTVDARDIYNCRNSTTYTQSVSACTSISTKEGGEEITIYPNPSTDRLFVKGTGPRRILIYDELGQILMETETKSQKEEINISFLSAGIFFVSISEKGKLESVYKFIKIN